MRYVMSFFPLIGAVIGALEILWFEAVQFFSLGRIAYVIVSVLLPVLITGGFHVDGFMDTSDAVSSFRNREKKLEILKDSHVGAFAVIRLALAAGIFAAAVSELHSEKQIWIFGAGFVLARALSALSVLHFPSATHAGSLFYTASHASRVRNTIVDVIWAVGAVIFMICLDPIPGILTALGALLAFLYYRWMSNRNFGGITGDLAGYFVVICEVTMAVCTAVGGILCS